MVPVAVLFFSKEVRFLGEVLSSQMEKHLKKKKVVQIRPGTGFKTGDFVIMKSLGGGRGGGGLPKNDFFTEVSVFRGSSPRPQSVLLRNRESASRRTINPTADEIKRENLGNRTVSGSSSVTVNPVLSQKGVRAKRAAPNRSPCQSSVSAAQAHSCERPTLF